MLGIGIAGLGTVGMGIIKIFQDKLHRASLDDLQIIAVSSKTASRNREADISAYRWYNDPLEMVSDPEIHIIVEVIGGEDGIALALAHACLNAGKNFVTANKALLAKHGNELFALANKHGVSLNFEAAIAGTIPVVKVLREGLSANHIRSISGILNGTCNYILSDMAERGGDFADTLQSAQQLGYAEADPALDIGGLDAAHKLALLSALAFEVPIDFSSVSCEGITNITLQDIQFANRMGYSIKLLALAEQDEKTDKVVQSVHPCLVASTHPLASVDKNFNAVMIEGSYSGPLVLTGQGAGQMPTASAVVADLVDLAQNSTRPVTITPKTERSEVYGNINDLKPCRYYLRINLPDEPGKLSEIINILAKYCVSIEVVRQDRRAGNQKDLVPIMVLVHETPVAVMHEAVYDMRQLLGGDCSQNSFNLIPIVNF